MAFTIAAFSLHGHSAVAQQPEAQAPQPAQQQTQEKKKEKIPDSYMAEASAVLKQCTENSAYNKFYNCDCLAAHMLDERIKQGPDANHTNLLINVQTKCKDGTNAAGIEYSNCLGKGALLPPDVEPEAFCSCYANTYAKIFEASRGAATSLQLIKMQSAARKRCQ